MDKQEELRKTQKKLESYHETVGNNNKMNEMELNAMETEVENARSRLNDDKREFELERERLIGELQVKRDKIEDRK